MDFKDRFLEHQQALMSHEQPSFIAYQLHSICWQRIEPRENDNWNHTNRCDMVHVSWTRAKWVCQLIAHDICNRWAFDKKTSMYNNLLRKMTFRVLKVTSLCWVQNLFVNRAQSLPISSTTRHLHQMFETKSTWSRGWNFAWKLKLLDPPVPVDCKIPAVPGYIRHYERKALNSPRDYTKNYFWYCYTGHLMYPYPYNWQVCNICGKGILLHIHAMGS